MKIISKIKKGIQSVLDKAKPARKQHKPYKIWDNGSYQVVSKEKPEGVYEEVKPKTL